MEFSIIHIEKAIGQFYQNLSTQTQLNLWLTSAQNSFQAWTFAWQLLDKSKSVEVQYFGASTLQIKISRHFHEIPANEIQSLQQKLLDTIIAYLNGPKIVLTRLCLSLSSLILHSLPNYWSSPFHDIWTMFQQLCAPGPVQPQFVILMLEILKVVPEEFESMHLSHDRRLAVRAELLKAANEVLQIINQVICRVGVNGGKLAHHEESEALLGIQCLSSWLQYGIGITFEDTCQLVEPLIAAACNEPLSEAALEALTDLVNHPEAPKHPTRLMNMLGQLFNLTGALDALRQEGCWERAAQFYGVFAAFGEGHTRLLLSCILEGSIKREYVLRLVDTLLQCANTPGRYPVDESCSHLSFSFWYILEDDICAATPEKHKIYEEIFTPVYLALTDVLLAKSMLSEDERSWSAEDRESFRCYRQDIGDTLTYCYKFLRGKMLERLVHHLHEQKQVGSWQSLEACLHALKAVAECVEADEETRIPQVLLMLSEISPSCNKLVLNTALETIGAYAEWLSAHPAYLERILPLLLLGTNDQETAVAATLALKDISTDCLSGIRPFAASLCDACEQALLRGNFKAGEKVRLMYILGKILSILPADSILASLNRVVGPCLEEIRILCLAEVTPQTKVEMVTRLKMLATLCTTLDLRSASEESENESPNPKTDDQQPVFLITQQMLPLLKGVVEKWAVDHQVVESVCMVLKHQVSTLLDACLPLLHDLTATVMLCHQSSPQSASLEAAKLVIVLFSQAEEPTASLIRSFLVEIMRSTLLLCGVPTNIETGQVDSARLAENTEVLASFLSLLAQLMKKTPKLINDQLCPVASLFHCGILGLTRPESLTFKSAIQFLVHFINCSRDYNDFVHIVQNQGQLLLNQTLRCIGSDTPRALVESLADILLVLSKKYFDNLCRWLNASLSTENFPSALVSAAQKENFARLVLRERTNKRRLQDIVREFCLHCRGLAGTDYAENTGNLLP